MSKFIVGLTGSIGSGKTAASDYFEKLGIEVVDADLVARQVVEPESSALEQIEQHFGPAAINRDGTLNRPYMRDLIFKDDAKKRLLEAITHPIIRSNIESQLQTTKSPYSILVSPLLFEMGQQQLCSRSLLIDCPETIQIQRASSRDDNDKASIQRIIDTQMSRSQKLSLADDVITNDRGLTELHQQIDKLHLQYMQLAML